jgi:hypothetical protein
MSERSNWSCRLQPARFLEPEPSCRLSVSTAPEIDGRYWQARSKFRESQFDAEANDRCLVEKSLPDVSGCDFSRPEKPDSISGPLPIRYEAVPLASLPVSLPLDAVRLFSGNMNCSPFRVTTVYAAAEWL